MKNFKPESRFYTPDYKNEKGKIQDFLYNYAFTEKDKEEMTQEQRQLIEQSGDNKYSFLIKKIVEGRRRDSKRLDILIDDLETYFGEPGDAKMLDGIYNNTLMYKNLFEESIQEIIDMAGWKRNEDEDDSEEEDEMNQQDILMQQREQRMEQVNPNDERNQIHPLLKRKVEVYIVRGTQTKQKQHSIRDLKAEHIGSLQTTKCIVIRQSEVRPQIIVASYICQACGHEIFQGISGITFTPLLECHSKKCQTNKTKGKLQMITQNCLFKSYQELIVQETSDQLPQGAIPRPYLVICRGENVRQCTPGDVITIQGVFCPLLENTFRGAQKQILDTYIDAFKIEKTKKKYQEITMSEKIQMEIVEEQENCLPEELYENLAASIAPEIHGHEDVKKALLLMMVGGEKLDKEDGLHIRGDINVALIGDPGIAKSQLLKQIYRNAPRSVYTTGKGSSGVGLTASVLKDPNTNEICLEAGALVLADKGVCCIDEFDKMNEHDRTAIYEVMEQQTVSIAKAGITTTLNARASILAAANPLYSRYNKKLTPQENINMPAALLSRFDLIFILLDKADENKDMLLAQHIGKLHMNKQAPESKDKKVYSNEFIRAFIAMCKSNEVPTLSQDVHKIIKTEYVQRRQNSLETKHSTYTTPRTLLSIIRLATAHAKIRGSNLIEEQDVNEALRLIDSALDSVRDDDMIEHKKVRIDNIDKVYNIISTLCNYKIDFTIDIATAKKRIYAQSLTDNDLELCISKYADDLGVLSVTGNSITLVKNN